MKTKKRLLLVIAPIIAIVLEALPYGAVLISMTESREEIRKTYSYFDIMPFGNANFGPLLTAISTCLVLILSIIFIFIHNKKLLNAIYIVSIIGVVTSLLPLLFGINFFSIVGMFISLLLIAELILSLLFLKK